MLIQHYYTPCFTSAEPRLGGRQHVYPLRDCINMVHVQSLRGLWKVRYWHSKNLTRGTNHSVGVESHGPRGVDGAM